MTRLMALVAVCRNQRSADLVSREDKVAEREVERRSGRTSHRSCTTPSAPAWSTSSPSSVARSRSTAAGIHFVVPLRVY